MNLNLAIRKSCGADGVSLGKGERALRPLLSGRLVNRLAAPAQRLNGRTGLACAFDLAAADRRSAQVLNRAKIEAAHEHSRRSVSNVRWRRSAAAARDAEKSSATTADELQAGNLRERVWRARLRSARFFLAIAELNSS